MELGAANCSLTCIGKGSPGHLTIRPGLQSYSDLSQTITTANPTCLSSSHCTMSFRAILVTIVATARLLGTAVVSATPVVDDTQAFAGDGAHSTMLHEVKSAVNFYSS